MLLSDRIIEEAKKKNSVLVVGLDPNFRYIPKIFKRDTYSEIEDSLFQFNKLVIDAVHDQVVAVKPQLAYYEVFGSYGIRALERTIEYAKRKELIVINDAKRGDILTTSQAYADAFLGNGPLSVDMVTVNPFLGEDGYLPFIDNASRNNKGLFLLLKTSNPSSAEFQTQILKSGEELYIYFANIIKKLSENTLGRYGYSFIGAVVGANHIADVIKVRKILKHNFFLVPGFGAQGGKAEDLKHYFDDNGFGSLISSSRAITYAYRDEPNWEDIQEDKIYDFIRNKAISDNKSINKVRF